MGSLRGSSAGLEASELIFDDARRLVSQVNWQIYHKMDLPGFEPGTFGNARLRSRCHNH